MTEPDKKTGKQTPGRQRSGQTAANRANRRNYASETDAARNDPSIHAEVVPKARNHGATGGPSTPQKTPRRSHKQGSVVKSPAPASGAPGTANNRSKRNNNGNSNSNQTQQPNNLPGTPVVAGALKTTSAARRTPPPPTVGRPAGTPASTAFAGATFHASPAPSSLPLPSFFTKKSPGTPTAEISKLKHSLGQQPSPPASDSEVPSSMATDAAGGGAGSGAAPAPVGPAPVVPGQSETPLEALFRADRAEKAEKERIRRASSANIGGTAVAPVPFSPPPPPRTMPFDYANAGSNTFPRGPAHQQHQHYLLAQQQQQSVCRPSSAVRGSSSGIPAAELDGTPGQPLGPSFAASFQERMRAVRSSNNRMSGSSTSGTPYSNQPGFRDAPSAGSMSLSYDLPPSQPPAGSELGMKGRKDARSEALLRFVQNSVSGTSSAAADGHHPSQHAGPAVFDQPFPVMASPQPVRNPHPITMSSSGSVPNAPRPTMNATSGSVNGPVSNQPVRMDNLVRSWINRSSPYDPGAPPPPSFGSNAR